MKAGIFGWMEPKIQPTLFTPSPNTRMKRKVLCVLLTVSLLLMPLAKAQSRFLNTKTQGKLSLVILLTGIAVVTELLVHLERKDVEKLHTQLGQPDKIVEFQKGFDRVRIEWYGEKKYVFRNGVLQTNEKYSEKK